MNIRKFLFLLLAALCLTAFAAAAEFDGYVVKLRPQEDAMMTLSLAEDALPEPVSGLPETYLVSSAEDVARLQATGLVEYAEPNYILELLSQPDDPYYGSQWTLSAIGWDYGGVYDGTGVTVAVVDSGLDVDHEEFADATLSSCSKNMLGDGTHADAFDRDHRGHGTFVASQLAAATNNGKGIAAPAHGAELMILRCAAVAVSDSYPTGNVDGAAYDAAYDSGSLTISTIAAAIRYAADSGADVINISIGGALSAPSTVLQEAVDHACQSGAVVVAAVGNSGSTALVYPAACDGAIGVGSVSQSGDTLVRSSFSQYNGSVDLTAPGGTVLGIQMYPDEDEAGMLLRYTDAEDTYASGSGTSFSAPVVSALAAICKQVDGELDGQDVLTLLAASATDFGAAGYDTSYGYGVVDHQALLTALTETEYPICYELGGGDACLLQGSAETYRLDRSEELTLPVPQRPGYDFCGWYDNADLTGSAVSVLPKGTLGALQADGTIGAVTYYAKWEPASVRLAADCLGLDLRFAVSASLTDAASACVTCGGSTYLIPCDQWQGQTFCVPVAAKEQHTALGVTVTDADGTVLAAWQGSFAETADPQDAAAAAALNLGAAAQRYFRHDTENISDTEALQAVLAPWEQQLSALQEESCCTAPEVILGSSLLLEDGLAMKFYFADGAAVTVSGEAVSGSCVVEVTDLFAAVEILQDNAVIGSDSAASYCLRLMAAGQEELAKAVLLYGLTNLG